MQILKMANYAIKDGWGTINPKQNIQHRKYTADFKIVKHGK